MMVIAPLVMVVITLANSNEKGAQCAATILKKQENNVMMVILMMAILVRVFVKILLQILVQLKCFLLFSFSLSEELDTISTEKAKLLHKYLL